MRLFLQFYLAYLVVDVVLWPWMTRPRGRAETLATHLAMHVAAGCLTVNVGLTRSVMLAIIALALVHVGLERLQTRAPRRWPTVALFQAAQALMLVAATASLTLTPPEILATIGRSGRMTELYLYAAAYVAVVFGGGYFVQTVTQPFLEVVRSDLKPGLPSAGRYIGWLERFLILTFVLSGYDAAIGFLPAAKALARYPEIKEDPRGHFAEYFLVGTLTSVGLALVAGLVVRKIAALFSEDSLRI